jgi:tripartite motif-containing protein 37
MIKNSHMCPHCSKLFCENCIKNWVVTKKSECPNCFHSLRLTMIVNCSQLGKELEEAIHVMERENEMDELLSDEYEKPNLQDVKSSPEIVISCDEITCSTHGIKLDYYCETCRKGICSDCAVLTDTVCFIH